MDEHDQQIQYYVNSKGHCPVCYTECETDTSGSNERDSSGDVHFCPKCGWLINEMSLWNYEQRI